MDTNVYVRIVRSDKKEFVIDGTDWKIPSDGLDGFGTFENDISTAENAVGDGDIVTSSRIAKKDRSIAAKSRNPLLNDVLRREAVSFFNSKMTYKIYVTYMGVTRWCEGEIYKFNLPPGNVHREMTMSMTFLCPDPFLRSYEDFGKNIASVVPMAGFPYLCKKETGVTGGRFNFAKMVVLENDGDVNTYCKAVFWAKGIVKNPRLSIGDAYVRVIDTMAEGDVIIMDFTANPPTIKKNGLNFIGHCDKTSKFDDMQLNVGDTEISFDADDGSNLLDVSIYYNKLYGAM